MVWKIDFPKRQDSYASSYIKRSLYYHWSKRVYRFSPQRGRNFIFSVLFLINDNKQIVRYIMRHINIGYLKFFHPILEYRQILYNLTTSENKQSRKKDLIFSFRRKKYNGFYVGVNLLRSQKINIYKNDFIQFSTSRYKIPPNFWCHFDEALFYKRWTILSFNYWSEKYI